MYCNPYCNPFGPRAYPGGALRASTTLSQAYLSPERDHCSGRPAHLHGSLLYFHMAGFGPQTVLDGRPPALMEADVEGRGSLRCYIRVSPFGVASGQHMIVSIQIRK